MAKILTCKRQIKGRQNVTKRPKAGNPVGNASGAALQ